MVEGIPIPNPTPTFCQKLDSEIMWPCVGVGKVDVAYELRDCSATLETPVHRFAREVYTLKIG